MTRLEKLIKLTELAPEDPLSHYGLALEHMNLENWAEAAAAFARCVELDPKYSAAYYHLARARIAAGEQDAARAALERGMQAAGAAGDWKTRNEMQELLESLA